MKLPLILAHGEGLVPVLFLGLPAFAAGAWCLGVGVTRLVRKQGDRRKNDSLVMAGVALLVVAALSSSWMVW